MEEMGRSPQGPTEGHHAMNRHYTLQQRHLALTAAALLAAGAIAGCSGQDTAKSDRAGDTATAAATEASTEASTEQATKAGTEEETMTEAEIASANTLPVEITSSTEYDSRYIEDYKVYVDAYYPSLICEEENYGMLKDGLEQLSQTIADTAKAKIDRLEEAARSAAADGYLEAYDAYAYTQDIQLVRSDSTVVSFLITTYENQGGAHPSTSLQSHNFDAQSGMEYDLCEIIQDDQYDGLATRIATALAAKYDHSLFNAYMELEMAAGDSNKVDDDAFVAALAEDIQGMIDDENLCYTVGQNGITFYFEAYSLAAYAAGEQRVTIAYEDAPELVWEGYTHAPAAYISAVDNADGTVIRDAGGKLHSLSVVTTSQGEYSFAYDLTITLDGNEYTGELPAYDVSSYVVHSDGRNYLYVQTVTENDWEALYVYDLNGSSPTYVDSIERWFNTDTPSDPAHMMLGTITHLLSTNLIEREYSVGENGMPVAGTDYDLITFSVSESITTLQEITAPVRDTYDGTATEETLPVGTALTPYATDNESWVDLQTTDGRFVRIEVTNDWPQTYRGTDVQELFDGLIFAG